jgi:hypothetical protein
MSRIGAAPRAAVPAPGAPPRPAGAKSKVRAATPTSSARAEDSRKNGAKSRGPKTPEGKARSALNALKHGMRAEKHMVLPQEDAAEFEALERAILAELAPVGALQTLLARRVAVAAWRLERADRLEAEVLEVRSYEQAKPGVALIRDGNATRSFETLLHYRGAAMAEFMRALRTLKALQAEQAADAVDVPARRPAARVSRRVEPNEPGRGAAPRLDYVMPDPPMPGPTLHEAAAPWLPHQPETDPRRPAGDIGAGVPNEPGAAQIRRAHIAEALSFRRIAPERR